MYDGSAGATTPREQQRTWRRGAIGDARLAGCFEKLGPEWRMLHAIAVGNGGRDIDHLLIGPGGVYTINSQHHAAKTVCLGGDTLLVNGQRVHHVRASRDEAAAASRALTDAVGFDVPVMGVVVIRGDRRFDVRHQPSDPSVHVTTPRASVRWLKRREVQWTSWGIDRIYEVTQRSSTWVAVPAEGSGSLTRRVAG